MDEHDGLKKTGLKATLPRLKIMDIFEHSKQTQKKGMGLL